MGRQKHRPGRAGTWLEVKVRNGQRYLYERTRVYQGGRSHITSKYLYKLPPAEPEYVKQPQATAHTPNRDHTDYAGQPKQKPRAAAGGEEMGRFAARAGKLGPLLMCYGMRGTNRNR